MMATSARRLSMRRIIAHRLRRLECAARLCGFECAVYCDHGDETTPSLVAARFLQLSEVAGAAVVSEVSFRQHQLLERPGKRRNAAVDLAKTLSRVGVVPRQEFPPNWEESEPIDG